MSETPGGENELAIQTIGRILALEELVVSLVASHARTNPSGVFAQILEDPEQATAILGSIGGGNGSDLPPGFLTAAKKQFLEEYIERANLTVDSWNAGRPTD